MTFNPQSYSPAVAELLAPRRLMPLGPGEPNRSSLERLEALDDRNLFGGRKVIDREMAKACHAGLWLYHDFLDQSHEISQSILTPSGSYWHGIMHRREPDFSNANYWFRRVGRHPVLDRLARAAQPIAREHESRLPAAGQFLVSQTDWDFAAFTDLCRRAQAGFPDAATCCRQVQQVEWELLFDYCYHIAIGDADGLAK